MRDVVFVPTSVVFEATSEVFESNGVVVEATDFVFEATVPCSGILLRAFRAERRKKEDERRQDEDCPGKAVAKTRNANGNPLKAVFVFLQHDVLQKKKIALGKPQ